MEKEKKRKSEREKERKKIEKEKRKKKNRGKRKGKRGRESECAPAIIAVSGRTWATGRRAARDGTMARKKRESARYGR